MLRIVQQATIPDNEKLYQRAIEEAQLALRRAVAARVPRDGSFGDRVPLGPGFHVDLQSRPQNTE
jgi:hypothetical protein